MPIEYGWTCGTRRAKPGDIVRDSGGPVGCIAGIEIRVKLDRLGEHVVPVVQLDLKCRSHLELDRVSIGRVY
jgi:hypothetical protein